MKCGLHKCRSSRQARVPVVKKSFKSLAAASDGCGWYTLTHLSPTCAADLLCARPISFVIFAVSSE
jgi:hypothetical protein